MARRLPIIVHGAASPDRDQVDRDYAVTHPLRPMLTAGVLSLGLFVLASVLSYATVRASPPPLTVPLLVFTAAMVAFWVVAIAVMVARHA
ncbi:MAG: hypothetical protein ACRYG4_27010, partial [Janthinobacterium lividum]